ncbi:MAG: helical backbone metal receptor, partial [Chthoniobacterales bacterium]
MHPIVHCGWFLGLLSLMVGAAATPPERIVSLAPNLTAMVIALGGGDRLVAVTPFCEAPAKIGRLPGGIQPEAEAVLGLEPGLVLATSMTPLTMREQLARMGLPVEVIDAGSLGEIRAAAAKLASLLGVTAPELLPPGKVPPEKSAALLFGAETGYSAGRGTHAHEILEAAGLRNIAADAGGPWPQLGEEFLLAADPDVIIVADYGGARREEALEILRRHPVRRHLAAVR